MLLVVAKITLYYYTATVECGGVPVVLNFSDTENFFCCTTKQGEDKKILTIMVSLFLFHFVIIRMYCMFKDFLMHLIA